MDLVKKLLGKTASSAITPLEEKENHYILVGAATHRGLVCDHNEDALFTLSTLISQGEDLQPIGLYILADGMGGHAHGGQISGLAVRMVANWVIRQIYQPFLLDNGSSGSRPPINEVLTEALVAANSKLHEMYPQGGTTLTCAFVLGMNAYIAHVGDSRAYLITRNSIRPITKDHSLVNRLIEMGQITQEEAQSHPQRNVLYRALGRAGTLQVDTFLQSLPSNSSLLLCTDGLWSMVSEAEILSIVGAGTWPQTTCHQLIAQANEKGGEDNITAVLIQT